MPSKTTVLTFKERQEPRKENRTFTFIKNKNLLFLHSVAFLMSRVAILQNLNPFGIGFYATLLYKDKNLALAGPLAILGVISVRGVSDSIPYAISIGILYLLLHHVFDLRKMKVTKLAFLSALTHLAVMATYNLVNTFYMYDLMMSLFEATVIFVTVVISNYAIPISLQKTNRKILSTEEIICSAIVTALCLAGINEVSVLGISIKNIAGILITMLFAYNGGAAVGSSVGIILGLITSMTLGRVPPVIIGIYGFSGLLSGTFREMGKIGSAIGFILGNVILTFYINGYYEIFIQLKEIILAFVLFLFIPRGWMEYISRFCNPAAGKLYSDQTYSERIKGLLHDRVNSFAITYNELSSTFEEIIDEEDGFDQEELSKLIEEVANYACSTCGMKRSCWDRNFNSTFQRLRDLLVTIETQGYVEFSDLPKEMQKQCIKPKLILEKMVHLYELNHLNMTWKRRMGEGRKLVGEQLKGVSQTLSALANSINDNITFDTELEDTLYVALDQAGLSVKQLMVTNSDRGNIEIMIEKKPCYNRESCNDRFVPVISKALGINLIRKSKGCQIQDTGGCRFTLVESNAFEATTKTAETSKGGNKYSGDSYSYMNIGDSQYMMAISDGMGSGEKAYKQSSATITMLEKMMEAGFDKEMAIKTINSMLILKSSKEMFSTVDLALMDLHKGNIDFIKIGTAPSFIRRKNGQVERITSSTLPVGIVQDIDIELSSKKIEDGDFIVMVSDGILEVNKGEGEEWFLNLLSSCDTRNPQHLADEILKKALQFTGNEPTDDMTAMVTKVWKTAN